LISWSTQLIPRTDGFRITNTFGLPAPVKGEHNHYALVIDKDGTIKGLVNGASNESKEDTLAKALKYVSDQFVSAY
jgi:hypothetical protein